jgi:uncharacterized protein YodC (DUF2158 family)
VRGARARSTSIAHRSSFHPRAVNGAWRGGAALMAMSSNLPQVKAGDRVQLKCGGPIMTAEQVHTNLPTPFAQCVWIDMREEFHRISVSLGALERLTFEEKETFSTP